MVTEATKKFREIFAYALLAVAALYVVAGLSLLFKSEEDFGAGFPERAAIVGYVFSHPILVLSLAAAVALVVGWGQASKNAKVVVLAALAIGAVALLFAIISWFSAFGADSGLGSEVFGGVFGAGKIVGIFLGLAQLIFLALTVFFAFTALQSLPKAAGANQWNQQGYGQQQTWGQPDQGYGQQQAWGQPQQQQGWGSHAVGGSTAAGWSDQPQVPEQQGQPASSWDQSSTGQQSWSQQEQPGWSQHPDQPAWGQQEQSSWAQQAGQPVADASQPPAGSHAQSAEPAAAPAEQSAAETEEEKRDDQQQPPQQGGWWQQPSS